VVAETVFTEILRYIEQQWSFMASSSCIPVKIALQLNDRSSLGLMNQYDQFQETHEQLQNALKVIVNEHHQGFNSSIGTFHKIQAAIYASQHRVRTLKTGLIAAKGSLASTRPELKSFAQSSQEYDHMLSVLAMIEQLQTVPEILEAEISEKRFLAAVETLQNALKLIRKPELEDIGALSDLRVYLGNQEHSLTDILVEELHSHLYLKSPYCEARWKAHARRDPARGATSPEDRALHTFLEAYNGTEPMQEDTTRNPEADTFYYIQLLTEALNNMSRLDVVVDAIEHRLPVELFRVVERSHSEVEQRHPNTLRSNTRTRPETLSRNEGQGGEHNATLDDLLNTLFAKFEAIAEGHSVLHCVIAAVLKREGLLDGPTLNRSFRELWKLLQSEIRTLLHDHLASNGNLGNGSRQENDPTTNIFRPRPRDKTRRLFRLADTDNKSTELVTEKEDLEYILKASVPGLVNRNARDASMETNDNDALPDRSATGHKLLVEPSIFNMGVLLSPCLSFLNRLREVVPPNSSVVASTLESFLDDFLINVFYPQLEDTLIELSSQCFSDITAFQPHPQWQQHAQKPIFRGTVQFFGIVESVCRMLDTLPHEQSFSQLVIAQMRSYYDRCYNWSKGLLQRAQMTQDEIPRMRLAADLATGGSVQQTVVNLLANTDEEKTQSLVDEESSALLAHVMNHDVQEADLIHDRKALGALCILHTSMKWLATRSKSLEYISPRAVDTANLQHHHTRRWTTNANLPSAPAHPYLPLDEPTAEQFNGVVFSFSELSSLILRTLHIDLRLHLLRDTSVAMRSSYALKQPYNDPDPAILSLATSISSYDAQLIIHLLPAQYEFLTAHLDALANAALVKFVALVPAMDQHGLARMQLNVLVLQQSLKAVQPAATLERAARFYELAFLGKETIAKGGSEGFEDDSLSALARLVG
jgi:exocyst complex component 4